MYGSLGSYNWNEYKLNLLTRINWRASLVPAAAVIPAPIAYIKIVDVKKLVVELRLLMIGLPLVCTGLLEAYLLVNFDALYWVLKGTRTFTLKKLECSKRAYA
eukprot:GHVU01167489.1.p1 GENE.GHVU01167489.1~~GHVU01167489.1.p1  ORF type:complete len:103 (-),score=2.02 GHVU01167489.1:694-1002(-)